MSLKYCACHEKVARSYEVPHLSRKIILANLKIWCSKMQPLSRNQRPDLLTSLMNMSLVLPWPRDMDLCRSSSNVPPLPALLKLLQNHHVVLTFDKVQNPLRLPCSMTSERPKVVRTCGFNILETRFAPQWRALFHHLNCQRCSRAWCVLYILTYFDLKMCFAPQQRALFHHLNFQKWNFQKRSETVSFLHFWRGNVLPATMACTFSSSQLLKMLREWCAFYVLTSKCALRHNGVQFFISSGQMALRPPLWRAYFSTLRSHKSL